MKSQHWFALYSILTLSLSSCAHGNKLLPAEKFETRIAFSMALLRYEGEKDYGSGFFVPGEEGVCTVLTTRHVTATKGNLQLRTEDEFTWKETNVKRFPQHDLALITFKPDEGDCPYKAIKIGDSHRVKKGNVVYIFGYLEKDGSLLNSFVPGDVTAIDKLPDGYGISYDANTKEGMNGGPVVNKKGEVVAIHGRSDLELASLVAIKGESLLKVMESSLLKVMKSTLDSQEVNTQVSKVKWSIPSNVYLANRPEISGDAVADAPTTVDFFNEGNDSLAGGRYEKALTAYDKFLKMESDEHKAWYGRGLALGGLSKYDEALVSYQKALEVEPDFYWAWFRHGSTLERLGKYDEAVASYDKAIEIKPDLYWAWYNRGTVLAQSSKYDEALTSLEKAVEIKPDLYWAWNNRGNVLIALGKYDEAVASYDKAIEIKPDLAEAWYGRGNVLIELIKYNEALTSFDKAIEIKPDLAEAWYRRGVALFLLKRYSTALTSLDKAIEIQPNFAEAWADRGACFAKLEKYDEALASLDKAVEIQPELSRAWFNHGIVLGELGKYSEAVASYDKALAIKPDYQAAIIRRRNMLLKIGRISP